MGTKPKDRSQRKLGLERIERLFELADKAFEKHPERAHRDVQLARKIAMRYNIRIPSRLKKRFCGKCYKYLAPNINCNIGERHGMMTVKCLECGNVAKTYGAKKISGEK